MTYKKREKTVQNAFLGHFYFAFSQKKAKLCLCGPLFNPWLDLGSKSVGKLQLEKITGKIFFGIEIKTVSQIFSFSFP